MRMPCSPSEPPVSHSALLAASCRRKPRPMVIMIKVRWRKRAMMKLVAYPARPATAGPTTNPTSGSPQPYLEMMPAV